MYIALLQTLILLTYTFLINFFFMFCLSLTAGKFLMLFASHLFILSDERIYRRNQKRRRRRGLSVGFRLYMWGRRLFRRLAQSHD